LADSVGTVYEQYEHFHAGQPVENGRFTLNVSPSGNVTSAVGKPIGGLAEAPTEVRTSEHAAVEKAHARAVSACSLREPLTWLERQPPPKLMVSGRHRRLVWFVTAVAAEPRWVEWTVEIDAGTGEVLRERGGVGVGGTMPGCSAS